MKICLTHYNKSTLWCFFWFKEEAAISRFLFVNRLTKIFYCVIVLKDGEKMKSLILFMEKLPLVAKVILALPLLDVVWVIYRIVRSLDQKNYVGVLLAVVLIVVGIPFLWLFDIISVLFLGHIVWID